MKIHLDESYFKEKESSHHFCFFFWKIQKVNFILFFSNLYFFRFLFSFLMTLISLKK
jgi:hypothetical protein